MFDVKTCQRKLAEHYQKTAKVPTTAWSSVFQVDLEQIYTRLSWVKQEQTTAGPSQKELNHYTEIFTEKSKNGVKAKRILVQGETGIGKTTFVKKLLVDWSNLEEAKMKEERKDALRKFDLVVSINLKEVSKCREFKEVLSRSRLFPEDEEKSVDNLLCYIRENQDKVLLVFDGYDEYRTGSEAEERYGSRDNSPIFEIFHGNNLRHCTVLVTTRSSRADEIRGPADIQAEITGFNMPDREDFMRKMLDSQTEVDGLVEFLRESKLDGLARVPLLSLFFCLLWKSEKEKLMKLTMCQAKLYQAIVKHILQHSHRRHSSCKTSTLKETDYDEILAEIGKVALAGLLKGDLVFEFGQLPEKVRGEEGVIVGLFQFSEYGPSLEPMEMVSFIHKSIQEYLAAWYLIYSCVPNGNLGEIGQHAATLEDCEALENVFQFVCGLSDEGAIKVLEHWKSVRISDPTLDLTKTIPDVEAETDVPVCDFTVRHERFSNLACNSFREVQSKAELLSHFLDCTGGVIHVTTNKRLSELMPNVKVLTKLAHNCVFLFNAISLHKERGKDLFKSFEFLNCLQLPLIITEGSKVLTVDDLLKENGRCSVVGRCALSFILCFRNGQFQFYITKLLLDCDDHAKLFTGFTTIAVPSNASGLCSEQSYMKFLSSLFYCDLSSHTVKRLVAVTGNCKHLSRIEVERTDDSICYLLEQVRNPSKCSLEIDSRFGSHTRLTSVGAVQLASLLPRFNNVIALQLSLRDCCAAALDTLVTSITHKTLKKLTLKDIILTSAATKAFGRSLPEMSSLVELVLSGVDGSILQAEQMEALFGRFNKTLPLLEWLYFLGFNVRGCLAPLIKSLRFFPCLRYLCLQKLNIDEHDQCGLLKSFGSATSLEVNINGESSVDCFFFESNQVVKRMRLDVISLTPAVVAMLERLLPEFSSLQELKLTGLREGRNILQAEEMEALFGRFNKTMPLLERLTFSRFNVRGCLPPLIKSLRFFPNLRELRLEKLNIDEHEQCSLLKSFGSLTTVEVAINGERLQDSFYYFTDNDVKMIEMGVISLTPAGAAMLGRLLPEIFLQELKLTGLHEGRSILQAEEMKALFGRFNKTMPLLERLTFSGFNVRGCLAPLIESLRFFPNLRALRLGKLNIDEHDQCRLFESFGSVTRLAIYINGKWGFFYYSSDNDVKIIELGVISLTSAVAVMLGRLLPELSSLQELQLIGLWDGPSILQAQEMEALFGGFNKTVPLYSLTFIHFNAGGCLVPFFRSFRFPNLVWLELTSLNLDEHDLPDLLESFQFIPNLKLLSLSCNPFGHAVTSIVTSIVPHVINLKKLQYLRIYNTGYSEKDLNYVRDIVQKALPDLKIVTESRSVGGIGFQDFL